MKRTRCTILTVIVAGFVLVATSGRLWAAGPVIRPGPPAVDWTRIIDPPLAAGQIQDDLARLKQHPNDPAVLLRLGAAYRDLSLLGDFSAAEKAVGYLKKARAKRPGDPLIQALLGSAENLYARDSADLNKKMGLYREGIQNLDAAVAAAPDNVRIRILRAGDSAILPALFNRGVLVKSDLHAAEEMVHAAGLNRKAASPADRALAAQVYYKLGRVLLSENKREAAVTRFHRAAAVAPDSVWAEAANGALQAIGQ